MKKIYIVTGGTYSDYHICEVFSSKEKAKEYIKKRLEIENTCEYSFHNDYFRIEEYEIDRSVDLAEEITVDIWFKYDNEEILDIESDIELKPKGKIKEEIKYSEKQYRVNILWEEVNSTECCMEIVRIKNKNKDSKSEIERTKKIGYDTIKRIKYIKTVLGITDISEINKMINKK